MKVITGLVLVGLSSYSTASAADDKLLVSEYSEDSFKLTKFESEKEWELSTEFGASLTTGNTDTQAFKGKLKGSVLNSMGRFNYHAQFFKKISDDEVSADKWKVGIKNNIDFSEVNSTFASLEFEQDQFAKYDSVAIFAAGYTQRMFNDESISWDADIGPGYKWKQNDAEKLSEYVMHLGTHFSMQLSSQAKFVQTLIADLGLESDGSNVMRSETSLLTSVLDNLKMKLTYALKHNSLPGTDKEKLDTQTTVSMVFIF